MCVERQHLCETNCPCYSSMRLLKKEAIHLSGALILASEAQETPLDLLVIKNNIAAPQDCYIDIL